MKMVSIAKCTMSTCAYNMEGGCHTLGISVGPHAECNTYLHASSRGGFPEVKGGIGACTASGCKFNNKLEWQAPKVDVAVDAKHAGCKTFQAKQQAKTMAYR